MKPRAPRPTPPLGFAFDSLTPLFLLPFLPLFSVSAFASGRSLPACGHRSHPLSTMANV